MRFLKKLAFNLIKDDISKILILRNDIEKILKAHDDAILAHYGKIVDDVEEILEKRNAEIEERSKKLFEEAIDEKFGEKTGELEEQFTQFRADIEEAIPTASQIVGELDYHELVSEIKDKILEDLDYSKLAKEVIQKIAKSCE